MDRFDPNQPLRNQPLSQGQSLQRSTTAKPRKVQRKAKGAKRGSAVKGAQGKHRQLLKHPAPWRVSAPVQS